MRRASLRAAVIVALLLGTAIGVAQVPSFRPVTDEMLRNPNPSDWLNWRRTYDGWGYSPLNQINRQTVKQLQLAWAWEMGPGNQQATPLIHDGVMYLASPGNFIQALNAATGDLLWEYQRQFPASLGRRATTAASTPSRSISIYDDKIFVNTADAHLVALDARTGTVVWDTEVADPETGMSFRAGALIVRGKVISGLQDCNRFQAKQKCAITAHDAKTGKELWRTPTIAYPGTPGGDTWGDLTLPFRAGTDMWMTGSYDPNVDLVYWSTSQAKPWAREARGTDGDALYSNTTLALDPDTGKVVWHYQYLPGETHDMDEVFENVLVDAPGQRSLFKMGKLGILWQIDRTSGKFISAADLRYQNLVDVDAKTGRVTYRAGMIPTLNKELDFCPGVAGFKSWRSMAYSPETKAFYVPLLLACIRTTFTGVEMVEGGAGGAGGGPRSEYIHPEAGESLGEFLAMDSATGRVLWRHRQRAPFNSAALTTGGGLVFVGDWNRYLNAYDAAKGTLLWQSRLANSPQGYPVTYAVNGKQYVAVPVGVQAASWGTTVPMKLTPELKRPRTGNSLYVFALPDATR